jgi:hypothetical protein
VILSTEVQPEPTSGAAERGHVESIGISSAGQQGRAEAVEGATVGVGGGDGREFRVRLQERGDDVVVLVVAERAGVRWLTHRSAVAPRGVNKNCAKHYTKN